MYFVSFIVQDSGYYDDDEGSSTDSNLEEDESDEEVNYVVQTNGNYDMMSYPDP